MKVRHSPTPDHAIRPSPLMRLVPAIAAGAAILVGVLTYTLFRPTALSAAFGQDWQTWAVWMEQHGPLRSVAFPWLANLIPDATWAFAIGIAAGSLVMGTRWRVIAVAVLAGASHECGQYLGVIPGAAAPLDLLVSIVAGLVAGILVIYVWYSEGEVA